MEKKVIVVKQETKKKARGFNLHLMARLRLLRRNLFSASESGTHQKKTASSSKTAAPKTRRKNNASGRSASGEVKKTSRPAERTRNAKPKMERTPVPAKKAAVKKTPPPMPEIVEVPAEEGKTRFTDLPLAKEILAAVQTLGFKYCTPIQALCRSEERRGGQEC